MRFKIQFQFQLPVLIRLFRFFRLKQIFNVVLRQKGATQNPHDFICTSIELKRSFNNSHSAVCNDSYINLYSYGIFYIPPEELYTQVTLYPFKEYLHDPSVFIKEGDVLSFQIEIVRIIRECTFEFRFKIYNPSDFRWIISGVSFCSESHGLISEDIIGSLILYLVNFIGLIFLYISQ